MVLFGLSPVLPRLRGRQDGALSAFNRLTPKDPGGRCLVRGAPYGSGPRRRADVYAPRWRAARAAPMAVFFYGGAWERGSRADYAFVGHAFAAKGFVTIVPDYRVAPEGVFPAFLEDTAAAIAWAQAVAPALGGDPDRMVLVGHSAGAYNAAMAALDGRYLSGAGATARAVRGVAALSGPFDFLPLANARARRVFGGWPRPEETQPTTFARPDAPPFLLVTGGADALVPPAHSAALARALEAAGGRADLVVYPGLDHAGTLLALSAPLRVRAPVLREVVRFARAVTNAAVRTPAGPPAAVGT